VPTLGQTNAKFIKLRCKPCTARWLREFDGTRHGSSAPRKQKQRALAGQDVPFFVSSDKA